MKRRTAYHLKHRRQFQEIYNNGTKLVLDNLIVFYIKNESSHDRHIGVAVTKKIGKAVVRNRIKRQFKEMYFAMLPDVHPGYDIVFVARKSICDALFWNVYEEIKHGLTACGIMRAYSDSSNSDSSD